MSSIYDNVALQESMLNVSRRPVRGNRNRNRTRRTTRPIRFENQMSRVARGETPTGRFSISYSPTTISGSSNNNSNSNSNSNNNISKYRPIPKGSESEITYDTIREGEDMVNFHGHYKRGQYFTKNTYKRLSNVTGTKFKQDPLTRKPIESPVFYRARLVGGKSRKTRSRR
jgi:hypothetical protein